MILVDSNILIDYYRDRNSELAKQVDSLPITLIGPVKTEVLHGVKDDDEADNILQSFNTFDLLATDEYDYEYTGLLLQTLRKCGIQLPMADALIAYAAIKYDIPLWSNNKHFKYIQRIYPELKLYEPEQTV